MHDMHDMHDMHAISVTVNGERRQLSVAAHHTLLQMLRQQLGLTGAKQGCASGECGACSVLLNGDVVNACLVLAVETDGAEVMTVEGLGRQGSLHLLQQAFLDHSGTQCGFCAPGVLMAAAALLKQTSRPDADEMRAGLAGNLCRCACYADMIKSIQVASRARR